MATAIEKGVEISNAKKEVRSVPTKKGNAPYSSATGSQVLSKKKPMPNAFKEGSELMIKVKKMAIKITTTIIAESVSVFLNAFSLKFIFFTL